MGRGTCQVHGQAAGGAPHRLNGWLHQFATLLLFLLPDPGGFILHSAALLVHLRRAEAMGIAPHPDEQRDWKVAAIARL